MTKEQIKEVLKANCYVGQLPNGNPIYEFGEGDLEIAAQDLDHKINTLNL